MHAPPHPWEWTVPLSDGSDTLSAPRSHPGLPQGLLGEVFKWLLFQEQPEGNAYAALQGHKALGSWSRGVGGGQTTCPEMLLDPKNITEHAAFPNCQAVTGADGPTLSSVAGKTPRRGKDVLETPTSFIKL